MKKLAVYFAFALNILNVNAQNQLLDSLKTQAEVLPDGLEKINTLLLLADKASHDHPTLALEAVESAKQLAEQLHLDAVKVKAGIKMAELFMTQFKVVEAHDVLDPTISFAEQLSDKKPLSDALLAKGRIYYLEGKYELSVQYLKKGIRIGEEINRSPGFLAGQYCSLGSTLRNTGNFEEALEYCRRGLAIYQQNKVPAGECYALTQLSLVYAKMGDFTKALEMEEKSLAIARENGDQYRQVVALHNICEWHLRLGNLDQALQLTPEIAKLNPVLNDINGDIELYKLLGRIFYATNDHEQALVNYQKALALAEKTNNASITAGVWQDMTLPLIALGRLEKAEKGLQKIILELGENRDSITLVSLTILLGDVKMAQSDYESAKSILFKAAEWYAGKTLYLESTQVYEKLAGAYLKMGMPDHALAAARKCMEYSKKTNSKSSTADAHLLLYKVYKELGDSKQALSEHESYTTLLDSIKTQDLRRRLSEERVKQNVEDLEIEKARAERESALLLVRNRLYITLGAVLLLILILGTYLYSQLRKTKKELSIQNQKLTTLNQEKDKFFSIIAHDLRSPLTAFQGVGEQLKYWLDKGDMTKLNKTSDLLSKSAANLSGLLDNLLSWALLNRGLMPYHPEKIEVKGHVTATFRIYENAAQIKGIQLHNRVQDDTMVMADSNALHAILRNLIGNAIKYTREEQEGRISVESEPAANGMVRVRVKDNGIGIPAEKLNTLFSLNKRSVSGTAGEKGAGLGLLLCKELVELHGGELSVHSVEGQGASFTFTLPMAP